ncbi:4Fe-4S binding protein [Helicobacter sp. L8]|uniref:4Fe-4S binding protein n=1 Tax=Helicobacter sp. L8 TaxID=2316078 RepID=UPI000EAE4E00|nr:4Fe-4S binding protein [Helicobacter sp. L8]
MNPKKPFREIFRGLKPKAFVIPLPYFNPQKAQACLECGGDCAPVCPERIVIKEPMQIPHLDFKERGCTFCQECLKACAPEVLQGDRASVIGALALIDSQTCLSHQGVVCFACKDACVEKAIVFKGMFAPRVYGSCTGCGMCAPVCPSQSILFVERKT